MRVLGKSIPDKDKMYAILSKGVDGLEIQSAGVKHELDWIFTESIKCPIYGIQTDWDICEIIERDEDIYYTCEIAQQIANMQEHDVYVVVHSDIDIGFYRRNTWILRKIAGLLKSLHSNYPNVLLNLKNTTPIQMQNDSFQLSMSAGASTIGIVSELQEMNVVNLKSLMDTCHVGISIEQLNIMQIQYGETVPVVDWIDFFKDSLGGIHLSWFRNLGCDEDHNIPFDETNIDVLNEILECYKNTKQTCDLVINVKESYLESEIQFLKEVLNEN